jgi:hypothetical protein
MIRLIDVRHTATSPLPADVANDNCVQDALARLRENLAMVDRTRRYYETQPAPDYLVRYRDKLFAWIEEARKSNARRAGNAL